MKNRQAGLSLVELLAVLAVLGVVAMIGALYLTPAAAPLQEGTILLESLFRQTRMKAMATTASYRLAPTDSGRITAERANSCGDEIWASADDLYLQLPEGVSMAETDWSLCFGARGVSSENIVVTLTHSKFGTRRVEVLLGGTTRVL